jgi:hypothetical protein
MGTKDQAKPNRAISPFNAYISAVGGAHLRDSFMKSVYYFLLAFSFTLGVGAQTALAPAASTNAANAAPTPVPPPSMPSKRSAAELEKLAIPIALHPDPLISIMLPAAVYPVEIVMAARFVKDTNNISKLDTQPWDENVKAVARFPELIAKMDGDLEWTIALGQAFLEQRKELMDTIQALRLKAQNAGTLKTTPQQVVIVTNSVAERFVEQQTVVVTNTVVQIQPANPEVIYVPSYPPTVYYPPPVYPYGYAYYGYGYYPYAPLVTFGVGMMWGAAISHWNHCNWHGGDVDIDVNRNANINRGDRTNIRTGDRVSNRQGWQADQNRLRSSGAPSAKTREARGWNNPSRTGGGSLGSQFGSRGVGGPSQQPSFGSGRSPARAQTQPSRSPGVSQRPSAAQRPASSGSAVNRSSGQRSSAFGGISNGGSSTRDYSNRGSYSRGGGGFSGGGFSGASRGGGRGGGGRGGGGRR